MLTSFEYYGLDFLAVGLALYAIYLLATHQAEKPIGGLRRRRTGILALLGANILWMMIGMMITEVMPILFVNVFFALVYFRNYRARQALKREFATRQLSRLSNGLDVLC